ncbi:MAG: anhydro-N-acetylmuramic acid kinase [Chloroflexi bacterium]|nr:anhydro-N-acetylmuramic acid kinase [Chloroflexota bacterium]MYA94583.1 anhydro-N-acetylmuramic acid kinase [Chloroflexota bacterium]MYD39161.1 anhydro-N-acetylmuramic acid kinase [Chloroflexota bacterium]MYE79822.1 anhydro-N-acetylmuramic acid kinase [Chloroflexota bacterium]MYH64615.1 anhydro-N-acetylmuramic acid kinase [Chloroflexota bacterium]
MIIAGLMSGTSADGIDIAICSIRGQPGSLSAELISGATYPYARDMRERILLCCDPSQSSAPAITNLHVELAEVFAQCLLRQLEVAGMAAASVDLIASHGQTIWHHVLPTGGVSASLQIGEAAVIAQRTGITTLSNFRARDIALGGQGAPLTSYVDWLLLRHPSRWRAIQNIGGMGNVTFLPPLSDDDSEPIAFDTGPGNALLDMAVAQLTAGAQTYDRDGKLAEQGRLNEEWLDELLAHPYYQRAYPKTTGRETFGSAAAREIVAAALARGLDSADIIATLTALTASNIADAYQRFAPAPIAEVILGGGGRRNPVMVGMLRQLLQPATILTHEDIGMDSDFKEALVFAVLAHETWHGRTATLPALTGTKQASLLGQITPGDNYAALLRATWRS